jgi:hypothetical protein
MPTTSSDSSTISSEALDLLDCFADGFDDVVYELAELEATKRTGARGSEIIAADMECAANHIVQAMSHSDLPDEVKAMLSSMLQCFSSKASRRKR